MSEFIESIKRQYQNNSTVINENKLNEWLENKTITQDEYDYIIKE